MDFQDEELNRIDSNLMQAKKILVDINEPRRLCLEELGLRRLFVTWVKDALEGTFRHHPLWFHPQVVFCKEQLSARTGVGKLFGSWATMGSKL